MSTTKYGRCDHCEEARTLKEIHTKDGYYMFVCRECAKSLKNIISNKEKSK